WDLADRAIILKEGNIIKELSRTSMASVTEEELHELGLRSNKKYKSDSSVIPNTAASVIPVLDTGISSTSLLLQNFRYKYKNGYLALNIPQMEIPLGKITAITGNNGVGKTTFLNCLCGLDRRSKGILTYNDKVYKRRARQKLIYLVMQDVNHQLFSESVIDEVLISQQEENKEAALKILSSLDIDSFADRHPMSLSGGQKQRLAVACAIASGRDIMLFDEPSSGLDYTHMLQIGKMLNELKAMGKTVIVVTHDRELIKECCDFEIPLCKYNTVIDNPSK
ncbi:MAG: ATP-binding cassette domain-containing protein, partial [Treponema sp.]|nr:ATP-binding cassette domain-containing protein [Treponema sp.]